ncbi:MAG: DUF2314 domain-containing protein [Thermoanaerobaculia bacterium]
MIHLLRSRPVLLAALLASVVFTACRGRSSIPPAGSAYAAQVTFEFALFYLEEPQSDPRAATIEAAQAFKIVDSLDREMKVPQLALRHVSDPAGEYAAPDPEGLRYFGRGLDAEQAAALQTASQVLVLDFAFPSADVWKLARAANETALAAAEASGALLWDEETREMFTPAAWRAARIDTWNETVPVLADHITIHTYMNGDYARAITLGMAKFGLPDVVVEELTWSTSRAAANMINAVCQSVAETGRFTVTGEYDLALESIRNPEARASQLENPGEGATRLAQLRFEMVKPEEGDPQNRIIALRFDRHQGHDPHAQQAAALGALYGSTDSVIQVQHTDELRAASESARNQLPALALAFRAGLAPGEYIQLKAPFATTSGGTEWMWVEVTSWKGSKIEGLLRNDPVEIPKLHSGQKVTISEDDVFDYIHIYPDGHEEGNTTGPILAKLQQ